MTLTTREQEFLTMIAAGKRDKEIARMSGVSSNTVRNTVWKAMRKLGAATRSHAVALMREPQSPLP